MNKQKFVELLKAPEEMSNSDLQELEAITKENPYFQGGHIVIARGSRLLKSPSAGKKINTAAIYATNRAILKHYMQGHSISKPATQKVKGKKPEPPRTPAPTSAPLKKAAAAPKLGGEKPTQDTSPRKAPELLSKSDHDILIDDIYANLEKWKKSRDQYLEYEKTSDEPQLSTKDENLEDAVEKIKNQIAEEVIAEDKEVNDQLEKIEASQTPEKPIDEEDKEATSNAEQHDVSPAEQEPEVDNTEQAVVPSEEGEVEDEIVENIEPVDQDNDIVSKEQVPEPESEIIEEVVEFKEASVEKESLEQDDSSLEQEVQTEIAAEKPDEAIQEDVVEDEKTVVGESTEEATEMPVFEIDEEVEVLDISDENQEDTEPGHTIEVDEEPDEQIEQEDSSTQEEQAIEAEAVDEPETVQEDVIKEESEVAEEIEEVDLSDDKVTSKIIDEEVSKSETPTSEEDEGDVDKKLESLNKEREGLHLKPRASKSGKKFRLSILRPTGKKAKADTSDKEKAKPVAKKAPTTKKTSKTVAKTVAKKETAEKKVTKKDTKKTETAKKTAEKPAEEKKTTKKAPAKKFKLGTSIAAKASKKVVSKKTAKGKEEEPEKKKKVTKKADTKSEKKKPKSTSGKKKLDDDQSSIIDSFLQANPTIKIDKNTIDEELVDLSEIGADFPDEAITENLAVILDNQDKNQLAIEVYEKLILKNPKKKAYFASQIQKIKKK